MTTTTPTPPARAEHVELAITGMTCASCAARIEKKLNRLDGVEATVNYATEKAAVTFDPGVIDADALVAAVEAAGYGAAVPPPVTAGEERTVETAGAETDADRHLAELRQRLLVSLSLAVPVALLSMVPALQFENWQWLALTLASPVAVWGAWPFHRAAWVNLRHGTATMDTLISVGVLAAYGWSLWALFFGEAGAPTMTGMDMGGMDMGDASTHLYLEVAATVPVFILTGRYLEARAKLRAGSALRALATLGAKDVALLGPDGSEQRVPIERLAPGDRFAVRPGEKVATDGVVVEGRSAIDTSLVTGESVPVDVEPGSPVVGATLNTSGMLVVQATRVGADTQLAQMARLVETAQTGKAPIQRLADRVSAVFVPVVILIALGTLAGWLLTGHDVEQAFTAAVAVLIIACPCALGLATPTALLVGTGRGAQLGVLIRGPEVLESTRAVDTIVLDKTGTVTTGVMAVVAAVTPDGTDRNGALRLVGALEAASEHPVAQAIALAAEDAVGSLPRPEHFTSRPGMGVGGVVDGHAVVAGRPTLLADWGLHLDGPLDEERRAAEARGRTVVVGAVDGRVALLVEVADEVKPTSREAIGHLRRLGLQPVLLTGDNETTARAVAGDVGIDTVVAGVLPEGKVEVVQRLQAEGGVVAMVGDGVNDAAALAQADLGLAMGTGTDVAIEASDLTLVRSDLLAAVDAIRLSRRTLGTIKGNLFWAFAYNVAAIPLAAAGLLNPMIAGAAMAFSSVFVVTNSLRLRRFRGIPRTST
jgi:Cu+-exporting ATPase